jgi:hypothetical protein
MNNLPKSRDQQLDDQLSEFTDLLLSAGNEIKMQETMNEDELAKLKKSVFRMKAAAQVARPSTAVSARVRTRLLKEWRQQTRQSKSLIFKEFTWSMPRLAMAGGVVVVLILSITMLFIPSITPLAATAEGLQAWAPLFILIGIALIIFLIWLDRRR